jgi:predicted metal-binding membrane protein
MAATYVSENPMDVLALVLVALALVSFAFAASGRELRRLNEIAVGLVFLTAGLICQFTALTGHTVMNR